MKAERKAAEIDKSKGGRPKENSLHAATSFQQVKEQANISDDDPAERN